MNKNKPYSNTNPIKRHIILSDYPITTLIEKNLNHFHIKTTTYTTKTIKQIVKNNSKNTDSLSNGGVYKICFQNCNRFYIWETSRNLNERIYEHKNDFKTGNTKNSLVSHYILTNQTFDFQNSAIFAFIHDKNKRRIIEACSIAHHNTIPQQQGFFQNFTIYRKNNIKRIQNSPERLAPLSLNIQSNKTSQTRFSNHKMPFTFQKIPSHDMTQFERINQY